MNSSSSSTRRANLLELRTLETAGHRECDHEDRYDVKSGLLLELPGGSVIGFNSDHPRNRRRFSVAHELGHYLLRHAEHFHLDLAIPAAWHGEPPGYDWRDERAANHFAAELLMPEDFVRRAASRHDTDARRLARQFLVSEEAMGFRLVNLGLR